MRIFSLFKPSVTHLQSCLSVTPLQVCAWLSDNEGSFKPRIVDGGDSAGSATKKETVRGYVQEEMHAYLRVPASTGTSEVEEQSWIKQISLYTNIITPK